MRNGIAETAVVLLAGGAARRFPGKLEHCIEGQPMLARCYERVQDAGWPVYICARATFEAELDRRIDAPMIIDRRPGGGPLRAFLDATAQIRASRLFAVAADQPELDAALLHRLSDAWQAGDEAVAPEHDGILEPLAALYDRRAVLRAGFELRATRRNAMRDLIDCLRTRRVSCDGRAFKNVNRPEDLLQT